jgi:hypothetical protein
MGMPFLWPLQDSWPLLQEGFLHCTLAQLTTGSRSWPHGAHGVPPSLRRAVDGRAVHSAWVEHRSQETAKEPFPGGSGVAAPHKP